MSVECRSTDMIEKQSSSSIHCFFKWLITTLHHNRQKVKRMVPWWSKRGQALEVQVKLSTADGKDLQLSKHQLHICLPSLYHVQQFDCSIVGWICWMRSGIECMLLKVDQLHPFWRKWDDERLQRSFSPAEYLTLSIIHFREAQLTAMQFMVKTTLRWCMYHGNTLKRSNQRMVQGN